MFAKLVKHEFIATRRIILFVYLATILMTGTNLLARNLDINWLSSMLLFLMVLLAVVQVVLTYALLIYRYYKNLYNSEGYLMHTLPVKAGSILFSKMLVAFTWLMASYLILLAVLSTVLYLIAGEKGFSLREAFQGFIQEMGLSESTGRMIMIVVPLYLALSIIYQLAQFYFAISMGSISRLHHLGLAGPVIMYLGLYFVLQIWVLLGLLFIPLGITIEQGAFKLVPEGMLNIILHPDSGRFIFGLGSLLFIVIAIAVLLAVTRRLIARHTSLR